MVMENPSTKLVVTPAEKKKTPSGSDSENHRPTNSKAVNV